MEFKKFLANLQTKKQTILMIVLSFVIISLIITLVQPIKYNSRLKLLIVQNVNQNFSDPYALSVSNEYLSNILSRITYSNSFFNRVLNSGFDINPNYFGNTPKKQEKIWNKTINVKALNDTGIIVVNAYHQNRTETEKIARAIGYVLMTEHEDYHGLGNSLQIKLLDEPITSKYPVKPNILLNLGLAIFLGLIFSLSYIYLITEKDIENPKSTNIKNDDNNDYYNFDDNDAFYALQNDQNNYQKQDSVFDDERLIDKFDF